jgi:CheY-like chemotaxis protein
VLGDVGQVEQVAMNLAVNARDAMPGGGRIQVELRNLVAGPEETRRFVGMPAGEYVLLGFQDDGQGMPAEVQAHIFEPFFTTPALGQGTGLGLSTVHGIVTQSEGFIRVESAPGQGTRFEIALPRARGEVAAGVAVVAAPRARGREVVLVVEDDAHVRAAAVRVLIDGGYRVLEAAGGEAALEQAERCPDRIDLTITDVVMPGLDGPGLSRLLRRARPGQRMLLISGHTGEFLARRGNLEAGQAFLQKPFTRDGLLEAVRAAIDAAPSGAGAGAQRT